MNKIYNANMWQKSAIQQQLEYNNAVGIFKNTLNTLMEHYVIKDNVFGYIHGKPAEVNEGYFVVDCEKDNLQDAIKEMDGLRKYVRILENKKFQVGTVHTHYNECDSNKEIFEI